MNKFELKKILATNARDAYKQMANLLESGDLIESRGLMTKEVLNVAVEVENPRDRIIHIDKFKPEFILQETFDILNSNDPRVIHSEEMLENTMGNSEDPMFFGNELRQAFSRWSLDKLLKRFKDDKNTRKAILTLGNRRNNKHTPCMIYAHFIIRDNKFFLTAETRGTALSMGFINDIFFLTLMQEIIFGWVKEIYPSLELGSFLYKTASLHTYVREYEKGKYKPLWSQEIKLNNIDKLLSVYATQSYEKYIQDMGVLYYYIDSYMKAKLCDDIDKGHYITYDDLQLPDKSLFNSEFFYNWAMVLYHNKKII